MFYVAFMFGSMSWYLHPKGLAQWFREPWIMGKTSPGLFSHTGHIKVDHCVQLAIASRLHPWLVAAVTTTGDAADHMTS